MSRKIGFLIIFALIILYTLIGYTQLPFKGIIDIIIILGIAVTVSFIYSKKDK